MMTRTGALRVVLCAALLAAALGTGCAELQSVTDVVIGPEELGVLGGDAVEATSTPTATMVVLCDVSGSTSNVRAEYVYTLERALEWAGPGYTVVVMTINEDSRSATEVVAEEKLPGFEFEPAPDPDTDNPLLLAKHRNEQRERLESAKRASEENVDVDAVRERILAATREALKTRNAPKTDVLGGLSEAAKVFAAVGTESNYLLLLTDGIREDRHASFDRLTTSGQAQEILGRDAAAGRVADLDGVRVFYQGANADGDASRYDALESYWSGYFAAAGAEMRPEWYGRRPAGVSLERWASR